MPQTIKATFRNNYGETRQWTIVDRICEGVVRFNGFLDKDEATEPLELCIGNGTTGSVVYQRPDGPVNLVETIWDNDEVKMS